MNECQEQPAEDEGYRVGNPQAFRQHRDDRGGDEQPNKKFYAGGWRHFENALISNCSKSLENARRIGICKSSSDLCPQKIHEQSPGNYQSDAATNAITQEGIH